jgi:tetratricopeptide (TPR) repeat protein
MAHTVDTSTRTPVTQLRESLDRAELLVVQVDRSTITELLTLLDSIDAQIEMLEAEGTDLRSEQNRWQGLLRRINNKPDGIAHAANAAGGFEKLRAENPPAESFWWHLDREIARRRVDSVRRMVITLVTIVVVAAVAYFAINYFFPPDPEAVLMVETTNGIDRLMMEQRWQEALELVQSARQQLPDNPELMVWEGVLHERLGNSEAANVALAEAHAALAETPIQFWIYLGNNRLRAGDIEGAQAAGDEAVKLDPNDPQATFLLGGVAEAQGDYPMAISYFEQTSELAEGTNPQLSVIARVRMGQLLQNPGPISPISTTPSPAP